MGAHYELNKVLARVNRNGQFSTSESRLAKDPAYHGQAKTVRDYVMESVISPGTYVVKPFQDNVMPRDFGERLSAGTLNKIVDYLSKLEEGKAPPSL